MTSDVLFCQNSSTKILHSVGFTVCTKTSPVNSGGIPLPLPTDVQYATNQIYIIDSLTVLQMCCLFIVKHIAQQCFFLPVRQYLGQKYPLILVGRVFKVGHGLQYIHGCVLFYVVDFF